MTEYQRVEINEATENPTLEEQAEPTQETVEEVSERPEWLPEKFSSAEDMAKAYGELEAKLSGGAEEVTDEEPKPDTDPTTGMSQEDMQKYSNEWAENGTLSDETYDELLSKYSVDRGVVDQFIQGQMALADMVANRMHALAGGPESYNQMIEWAKENLSEGEQAAYDKIMEQGDESSMEIAIRGLHARFAGGGRTPTLVQGKASTGAANAYRSIAELRTAMSDPRYKNDPAYRKDVEERLAVSNVL